MGIVGQGVGAVIKEGGSVAQDFGIIPGDGQGNIDDMLAPVGIGVGIGGGVDEADTEVVIVCPVTVLGVGDESQGGAVAGNGGAVLGWR